MVVRSFCHLVSAAGINILCSVSQHWQCYALIKAAVAWEPVGGQFESSHTACKLVAGEVPGHC